MNISEWGVHRQVRLSLIVADLPAYFKRAASYTKRQQEIGRERKTGISPYQIAIM